MKFYLMYQLIPFLFTQPNIKNKYGLITSIMLNKSNYKIILKNNIVIKMPRSAFTTLYNLLCILRQCVYHNVTKDGTMVVSFDFINKFDFNLKNLTVEDKNLIDVLSLGHLFGANFITPEDTNTIQTTKTLKIFEKDGKKILETNNGVMYFIENLVSGIVEAFIMNIHKMNDDEDWKGKTVVDVGASMGDTPLYYASMGAKVYAFEISESIYNNMLENIELNPQYKNQITPVNAAIGKDGMVTYFSETETLQYDLHDGATLFSSRFTDGIKPKEVKVQGYTLESVYKKWKIENIDLLKMDCKGCEFLLSENDLKNVKALKIEYMKLEDEHKIKNLLKMLESNGYKYRLFKHTPLEIKSFNIAGNIYAEKIVN